jgi:Uma2 family endonuclease
VEGELVPLSSGTPRHAKIRSRVERLLNDYFDRSPIGETFVELDCLVVGNTVRRPDVSVFLAERRHQIDPDKIPAPFAPDIAIEVLSLSDTAITLRRKVLDYLRSGSKEVWLVDHSNGEISVHTNTGMRPLQAADVLASPLLPGFSASVAGILVSA